MMNEITKLPKSNRYEHEIKDQYYNSKRGCEKNYFLKSK